MRDAARVACRLGVLFAVLVALLSGGSAFAHKLKVFATAEGTRICGYVYFPGGGRAKAVKVEVLGPAGTKLGEATTDGKGEFTFEARVRCDHTLVADSGDGHRATFLLEAAELPDALPTPGGPKAEDAPKPSAAGPAPRPVPQAPLAPELTQMLDEAVARHVRPLREQLERYEEKRRLHDILGGIGYIVGITGLAFYFLGARRRKEG